MGNLIESDDLGNWGVKGLPWKNLYVGNVITREIHEKLYGCLCKLKDYEETGLSPEQIEDMEYKNGWIPCSERLPKEHDSIFAKAKGTDKWNDAMFEKVSDVVNVTVVDKKGNATTTYAHTTDGDWNCDLLRVNKSYRIIAWQPLPEPYETNN